MNDHQIICFLYIQLEWHTVAQTVGRSLHIEIPSFLAVVLPCTTVFHLSLETNKWPINSWHLCLYVQLEWNTVAHGSATAGGEGISICKLLPTVCSLCTLLVFLKLSPFSIFILHNAYRITLISGDNNFFAITKVHCLPCLWRGDPCKFGHH